MSTWFYVRVVYDGRTFERAFESAIQRAIFIIDAKKFGARVTEEWADAAPDVAPANEQIVTTAAERFLRSA